MKLLRRFAIELFDVKNICGWRCLIVYLMSILVKSPEILRTRTLMPADKAMLNRKHNFRVLGKKISLDGEFFGLAREIYGRQVYFSLPGFSLKPTDTVVDMGAHAGVFSTLAAMMTSKVIAIEAQSGLIDELRSNIAVNGCSEKVNVEFGLIGRGTGLFSDKNTLESASHFGETPPQISVTELFARHKVSKVDFLKMDIEGSEFDLFGGDVNWLDCVDKIAMEVHPGYGDPERIAELLRDKGYAVWFLDRDQKAVEGLTEDGFLFAKVEL